MHHDCVRDPRVAVIIIRDRSGWYFLNRRSADRALFPGYFGIGAGGKVHDSESVAEAARRELHEETGLVAQPRGLFTFRFEEGSTRHKVHVFQLIIQRIPLPNHHAEWSASGWVPPSLVERLFAAHLLSPDTSQIYAKYRIL
jgi:8-oxo-dGTP pyrophosphatase MutT (NUDIX family)